MWWRVSKSALQRFISNSIGVHMQRRAKLPSAGVVFGWQREGYPIELEVRLFLAGSRIGIT